MSWWLLIHSSDIATKEESTISASAVLEWKKTQNLCEFKGYVVLYKLSQLSTYWNVIRTNGTQVSLQNIQPRREYTVRVLLLSNVTYISQTFTLETGVGKFPLNVNSSEDINLDQILIDPTAIRETVVRTSNLHTIF